MHWLLIVAVVLMLLYVIKTAVNKKTTINKRWVFSKIWAYSPICIHFNVKCENINSFSSHSNYFFRVRIFFKEREKRIPTHVYTLSVKNWTYSIQIRKFVRITRKRILITAIGSIRKWCSFVKCTLVIFPFSSIEQTINKRLICFLFGTFCPRVYNDNDDPKERKILIGLRQINDTYSRVISHIWDLASELYNGSKSRKKFHHFNQCKLN